MPLHKLSLGTLLMSAVLFGSVGRVDAQSMWKYVDKDGKITYSDKAPKKGETATPVAGDASTNIIDAPKNLQQGKPQKLQDVKARAEEREKLREKLRDQLEQARDAVKDAKAALADGQEPREGETQVVVGRTKTGAPTGVNSQLRKPEYYARIASLEAEVKKAEEKLDVAERNYRTGAP